MNLARLQDKPLDLHVCLARHGAPGTLHFQQTELSMPWPIDRGSFCGATSGAWGGSARAPVMVDTREGF